MTKAFNKIAGGLADAIAYAEGDTTKGRVAAGQPAPAKRGARRSAKTKLSQAES